MLANSEQTWAVLVVLEGSALFRAMATSSTFVVVSAIMRVEGTLLEAVFWNEEG